MALNRTSFIANCKVDYLVRNGIGIERLIAKGFGPFKPISRNANEDGRSYYRTIEMKVIE